MLKPRKHFKAKGTTWLTTARSAGMSLTDFMRLLGASGQFKRSGRLRNRFGSIERWDLAKVSYLGVKVPIYTTNGLSLECSRLIRNKELIPTKLWLQYQDARNAKGLK